MKNCLEQFFPVEERPDGVYIKVGRSERDAMQPEMVLRQVDASMVMNFDAVKFRDVFSRARGVFEKIGPLFEYYDPVFDEFASCGVSPLKATVKISEKYIIQGKKPTVPQLAYFLKRKGVVHGLDTAMLARIVTERLYDRYVDVAAATPPQNGSDARIEIKVSFAGDARPEVKSDGSVDYRNIKTFTPVAKDDLLAVKYPATPGKPGTTITGEPINAPSGKDMTFPNGRNTQISPDGLQLLAAATGIVCMDKSMLTVVELLHIGTDVDYSVGNIKYSGDILIDGSVKPGFTVEAEGSIHIKGEVESAKVTSRAGSVVIDKGIVGKGDTVITAKAGIQVSFVQDAHLQCEGPVTFEKFLLHSRVTGTTVEGTGHQAGIIGGEVMAEQKINIKQCGSEKGIATHLTIFDKNKAMITGKIKELTDLQSRLSTELEAIERQLKTKASLMKRAGEEITDRHREEVRKWVHAYNGMKKKIDFVAVKIAELKRNLCSPVDHNGSILIHDRCFPGTVITLYDMPFSIDAEFVNKRFSLKNQSVAIEGLSGHEQSE